jgi:hypothetical protein
MKNNCYEIGALLPSTAEPAPLVNPSAEDRQQLSIQESCNIFPNQVFVANRIVQRIYDSGAADPRDFDAVSFAFATEVALSLQEQTAQRVSQALRHVPFDATTPNTFAEKRVWMYHASVLGQQPTSKRPKFKDFVDTGALHPIHPF